MLPTTDGSEHFSLLISVILHVCKQTDRQTDRHQGFRSSPVRGERSLFVLKLLDNKCIMHFSRINSKYSTFCDSKHLALLVL